MSNKLLDKNIEPKCEYCKTAREVPDKRIVLCERNGIMDKDFACRKFVYDPLKRTPVSPDLHNDFDASDFEI